MGHGFDPFLNGHEGAHSSSSNIPLVPGHVIINAPGFCEFPTQSISQYPFPLLTESSISDLEGGWGMCIKSALIVRRVVLAYVSRGTGRRRMKSAQELSKVVHLFSLLPPPSLVQHIARHQH